MSLGVSESSVQEIESFLVYFWICKHLVDDSAHVRPHKIYESLLWVVELTPEQINGSIRLHYPATSTPFFAEKAILDLLQAQITQVKKWNAHE